MFGLHNNWFGTETRIDHILNGNIANEYCSFKLWFTWLINLRMILDISLLVNLTSSWFENLGWLCTYVHLQLSLNIVGSHIEGGYTRLPSYVETGTGILSRLQVCISMICVWYFGHRICMYTSCKYWTKTWGSSLWWCFWFYFIWLINQYCNRRRKWFQHIRCYCQHIKFYL